MKTCTDCAHFNQGFSSLRIPPHPSAPFCRAPESEPPRDPVYGHLQYRSARPMRANATKCGEGAKWFTAKPVKVHWLRRMVADIGAFSGYQPIHVDGTVQPPPRSP